MNKEIEFEQFTMFNLKPITNNILYWENALSYSNELSNFIELLDNYSKSHNRIPKWNNNIKIINKDSLKKSTGSNLLDKRTLYVVNSLIMAFEMCFDRYCEEVKVDKSQYLLNLNNMIIKKNNQSNSINLDDCEDISYKSSKFIIIAYINDEYQGGEIAFPDNNIFFKPKAGSVLIIPFEELSNYGVEDNINGISNIAYTVVTRKR